MRSCRRWSEEENDLMRQHYSRPNGIDKLIELTGRSRKSLWIRAIRMKLPHYQFLLRGAKGVKGNKGEGAAFTIENLKLSTTEDLLTGCWNWNGSRHKLGYGKIMIDKKSLHAHRVMFAVANPNVLLDGLNVNHHCDNASCINPLHLYAGTQKDNVQDQIKRGRHRWQIQRVQI